MKADLYLIMILTISITGCRTNQVDKKVISTPDRNEMADLNRYFIQKDRERIQNYIERKNLSMKETPTGLWYQITRDGGGNTFTDNDKVVMDYECYLLDGTLCYTSDKLGRKEIILGKTLAEQGLNEGLRLLRPGASAIFIIPPFLAYGLIGDRKMIPSRAVIVYYVNISPGR